MYLWYSILPNVSVYLIILTIRNNLVSLRSNFNLQLSLVFINRQIVDPFHKYCLIIWTNFLSKTHLMPTSRRLYCVPWIEWSRAPSIPEFRTVSTCDPSVSWRIQSLWFSSVHPYRAANSRASGHDTQWTASANTRAPRQFRRQRSSLKWKWE